MRIIENLNLEIPGTNTHYFNLSEFSDPTSRESLYLGYTFLENQTALYAVEDQDRTVYLNVTMPTEFCSPQPTDADKNFDEVWTICPYSVDWLNEISNTEKYKLAFYPINKSSFPEQSEKKYDVIYHGGLHGEKYVAMLNDMRGFNYRYASLSHGINGLTQKNLKHATDLNLSNEEKFKLISECRISIAHNTFEVRNVNDLNNIKSRTDWQKNEAWKHVEDLGIVPQFKSRVNEAAASRTLNLVKKDPWNVIEYYYHPDEDFVYYENDEDLKDTIKHILSNWGDYKPIVDNAYNKVVRYTTDNLVKDIRENKSWK